jgi:ATP-dependent Clp protease ATP-binding subunit ClpA
VLFKPLTLAEIERIVDHALDELPTRLAASSSTRSIVTGPR